MSSDIVQVEQLRHVYHKGRVAVDGVSFSVARGEIFGLLGPNGAGKTTTVRMLTTILRPTSGRAFVAGHDVAREPLAVRRSIVAVLQENAVETLLSTRDNLLLYGYLHGYSGSETRKRVDRVIEALELAEHLNSPARALSGGYKRRLQVAKALMIDAPVIFLDEATTGMDPLIKRRVVELIRQEGARGRTVLLTTQLLDEAEALCHRMVLMKEGKVLAAGTMPQLRNRARKAFRLVVRFQHDTPETAAVFHALTPRTMRADHGEYELTVEGSEDQWIREMARISERHPLEHLEIRAADLEEIFFELYGDVAEEAMTG
jgi:ABC-2 type transport system ATP-binding protein